MYIYIWYCTIYNNEHEGLIGKLKQKHGDQLAKYWTFDEFWFRQFRKTWFHRTYPKIDVHFFKFMAPKKTPNGYRQERWFADVQILWFVKQNGDFTTKWTGACGSGSSVGFRGRVFGQVLQKLFYCKTIGSTIPYHVYGWINHQSMAVHQSPCRASAMRSKDSGCGAASSMKNFPQTLRQQGNRYRQVPELRAFFLTSRGELTD